MQYVCADSATAFLSSSPKLLTADGSKWSVANPNPQQLHMQYVCADAATVFLSFSPKLLTADGSEWSVADPILNSCTCNTCVQMLLLYFWALLRNWWLQMAQSEANYTQQLCSTCAEELVEDFDAWWVSGSRECIEINDGTSTTPLQWTCTGQRFMDAKEKKTLYLLDGLNAWAWAIDDLRCRHLRLLSYTNSSKEANRRKAPCHFLQSSITHQSTLGACCTHTHSYHWLRVRGSHKLANR
jgi:hypothetical protein